MCALLVVIALAVRYPKTIKPTEGVDLKRTIAMTRNRYAIAFSMGAFLYVASECAVYVWMPTLLANYKGSATFIAAYSISIFFMLRAAGRFAGAWMLSRFSWTAVLVIASGAILTCFVGAVAGGGELAVYLLPFSGLFMSVIYPTINSKGISCFPKSEHGAVSGVILFFTCVSAAVGPLAMGAVSDLTGSPKYGFVLAAVFAGLLFAATLVNWIYNPTRDLLKRLDQSEYRS
jgi:fucose permease